MNTAIPFTQAGLDQLKAELVALQNSRPAVVERLSVARSMGDLSENSEYTDSKEELSFLDGRIAEIEEVLKNAVITAPQGLDAVDFGHFVTVKVNSTEATFQVVGEWEADPSQKKISHSSPLGKALIGKKIGENIEVDAPAGKISYTITGIK